MRSLRIFRKLLLDYGNATFDCGECDGLDIDHYSGLYEKSTMARRSCIRWAKKSKEQNKELKKQLAEREAQVAELTARVKSLVYDSKPVSGQGG